MDIKKNISIIKTIKVNKDNVLQCKFMISDKNTCGHIYTLNNRAFCQLFDDIELSFSWNNDGDSPVIGHAKRCKQCIIDFGFGGTNGN